MTTMMTEVSNSLQIQRNERLTAEPEMGSQDGGLEE